MNTFSGKPPKVFMITPEWVFTINQNRCSRSARIGVHVRPEYAVKSFPYDTHPLKMVSTSPEHLTANLFYLKGHNLIEVVPGTDRYRLTSKGVDYLKGDGGLSAILATGTVRIAEESLIQMKALILSGIEQSKLTQEEKSKFRKLIDGMNDASSIISFFKNTAPLWISSISEAN